MILGILGGFVLAIGSFLNWATVTVNFDKLASALGIDPALIPDSVRSQSTVTAKGWGDWGGKATLAAGLVVLVLAVLLITAREARVVGAIMVVAGAVGGGVAVYYATVKKEQVLDAAGSVLSGAGLPGQLSDFLSLSLGIGLWLCMIGGLVAIISGIMAMVSGDASALAMADGMTSSTIPPPDGGFDISSVAGSMAPPPPPTKPGAWIAPTTEPAPMKDMATTMTEPTAIEPAAVRETEAPSESAVDDGGEQDKSSP